MSRKRTLKKQQKRQESALAELQDLYRRGADDAFLARVAEQGKDLAESPLATQWQEAAGRALRQSLARPDLGRLERLLASLRRCGPLRPEAVLAEAVLDIAAGRLDAARSRLAALAGSEGAAFPQGLLQGLRSLAQEAPDGSDGSHPQAAGELLRALRGLEARAFVPAEADHRALARSVEAVRTAAPEDAGDLHRLLDGAGRCLSLLADLAALADKLAGLEEEDRAPASQVVAGWLRGPGPLLAALLSAAMPALLAPLRHAVRLRWRAVLEQVAAREGPAGLAALCALDPKLLAIDLSLPGGLQTGLASLRQGAQARQLLAGRRFRELAHLLRSRGETETDSGTLAILWSLEIRASSRRTPLGDDARGDDWLEDVREPPAYRTLVRLQQMSGEIGRRFPPEQRRAVAHVLRGELFDLCEKTFFGKAAADAALALLEHQPGDLGLLIVAVAGAVAGEDARTLRSVEAWLARAGKPQADDPSTIRRLMAQVALEVPRDLARILGLLRPLFADGAWPETAALVAREMSVLFADALTEAAFEIIEKPRLGNRPLDELRRKIDPLRPALAGTSAFAALDLALDCWSADRSAAEKRLKKFLAAVPDLEGPLTGFRILQKVTTASLMRPKGAETVRRGLAHAVIDRLDERWHLWGPSVEALANATRGDHLQRLEEKLRQLLASPQAEGNHREIEKAFVFVQRLGQLRVRGRRRESPSTGRSKKPRQLAIPRFG